MIYLASPYWHESPQVRARRTEHTLLIARSLLRRKIPVFSPIVHGHTLSEAGMQLSDVAPAGQRQLLPFTHQDWLDVDFQYLERCSSMLVAQLEGWRESKGVNMELNFCSLRGIPVFHILPTACTIMAEAEAKLTWAETAKAAE